MRLGKGISFLKKTGGSSQSSVVSGSLFQPFESGKPTGGFFILIHTGGNKMRLLIMGPPGAGKGTQAEVIAARLQIEHLSSGDLFRQAIKNGTELGRKAQDFMNAGKLVPDAFTVNLVREHLSATASRRGFILDGFPRTLPQAEMLSKILMELGLPLQVVLNLEVPLEKVILRLTGRLVCPKCRANYHLDYKQPQEAGKCNTCGVALDRRIDDNETTIRKRYEIYTQQTQPLIVYYQVKGLVKNIDGAGPVDQVLHEVGRVLGREW